MKFDFSRKVLALRTKLLKFMDKHVYPNEAHLEAELSANAITGCF